jgi:hypothetical protein
MIRSLQQRSIFTHLRAIIGWTPASSMLLGGFFLVCGLIAYIWWPLAKEALSYIDWNGPWWFTIDWLLIGIFAFMSLSIIAQANLKHDVLIIFVGMFGGLVIESWGTQTNLWHYFTAERPPLWIIPAWPIASLSIDRITRSLNRVVAGITKKYWEVNRKEDRETTHHRQKINPSAFKILYYSIFSSFFGLMLYFVLPFLGKPTTIMALLLVVLVVVTVRDHRNAVLIFLSGSGLGYFLEQWGTSRQCWTYYTCQTPPVFAVLAHGMAAVAFWQAGLMMKLVWDKSTVWIIKKFRCLSNLSTER